MISHKEYESDQNSTDHIHCGLNYFISTSLPLPWNMRKKDYYPRLWSIPLILIANSPIVH